MVKRLSQIISPGWGLTINVFLHAHFPMMYYLWVMFQEILLHIYILYALFYNKIKTLNPTRMTAVRNDSYPRTPQIKPHCPSPSCLCAKVCLHNSKCRWKKLKKVWLPGRIPKFQKIKRSLRVSGNLPKLESKIFAIQLLKMTVLTERNSKSMVAR